MCTNSPTTILRNEDRVLLVPPHILHVQAVGIKVEHGRGKAIGSRIFLAEERKGFLVPPHILHVSSGRRESGWRITLHASVLASREGQEGAT